MATTPPPWPVRGVWRGFSVLLTVAVVTLMSWQSASGAIVFQETKLQAPDSGPGQRYGLSVAVSGDQVVVGAQYDDDKGVMAGAVYLHEADGAGGWNETKLVASDGATAHRFGASVAAWGDLVVVGAIGGTGATSGTGAVYVYEPDAVGGWTEAKLSASDGAPFDNYGGSVGVWGDRIVVGASQDDTTRGSVYVYDRNEAGDWVETKLTASDRAPYDNYGRSVAVAGDTIAVGATHVDNHYADSGAVYVYEASEAGGWNETRLIASDSASNASYGYSVAVSSDRVVVGAFTHNGGNGQPIGSAYVYERNGTGGWAETKLVASDGAPFGLYGVSVAVSGDRVLIGAAGDDDNGESSGSVYLYEPDQFGGWVETKRTASDGTAYDYYGQSVAASGERIVVGAYGDAVNGEFSGSAYTYTTVQRANYDWDGFAGPVANPAEVNTAKSGRTIPVKFAFTSDVGEPVTDPSVVTSVQHRAIGCDTLAGAEVNPVQSSTSTNGAGVVYDAQSELFQFNWKTPKPGCYELVVTLETGQKFPALFNIR